MIAGCKPLKAMTVYFHDPAVVSAIVNTGLVDISILECEHSPRDWSTIRAQLSAGARQGHDVWIKIADKSNHLSCQQLLDAGATHLLVPALESAEEVSQLRMALSYPPHGSRGATSWSLVHGVETPSKPFIAGVVETLIGAEAARAMMAVPGGLDAIVVGRLDLSRQMEMQKLNEEDAVARSLDVVRDIIEARRDLGRDGNLLVAANVMAGESIDDLASIGCDIVVCGSDYTTLVNAISRLAPGRP